MNCWFSSIACKRKSEGRFGVLSSWGRMSIWKLFLTLLELHSFTWTHICLLKRIALLVFSKHCGLDSGLCHGMILSLSTSIRRNWPASPAKSSPKSALTSLGPACSTWTTALHKHRNHLFHTIVSALSKSESYQTCKVTMPGNRTGGKHGRQLPKTAGVWRKHKSYSLLWFQGFDVKSSSNRNLHFLLSASLLNLIQLIQKEGQGGWFGQPMPVVPPIVLQRAAQERADTKIKVDNLSQDSLRSSWRQCKNFHLESWWETRVKVMFGEEDDWTSFKQQLEPVM